MREEFQVGFAVDFVESFFILQTIYFGQILLHWIFEGENNPLNVFLIFRELRWKLGSNPTQWESWNPHIKELRFPDKSLNHLSNKSDLIKHRLSLIKWPHKNAEKNNNISTLFSGWVSYSSQRYSISRLSNISCQQGGSQKFPISKSNKILVIFSPKICCAFQTNWLTDDIAVDIWKLWLTSAHASLTTSYH